jgi:hypothetical protein
MAFILVLLDEMDRTCGMHCGESEVHITGFVRRQNGSELFAGRNTNVTYLEGVRDL